MCGNLTLCEKCHSLSSFDSYFNQYVCTQCRHHQRGKSQEPIPDSLCSLLDVPPDQTVFDSLVYTAQIPPSVAKPILRSLVAQANGGYCIAIDFDGTLCENKYPMIGERNAKICYLVWIAQCLGFKTILWTCREGQPLKDAVQWCAERGIFFDAVNQNLPERIVKWGTDPRKIGADEYWDDRAVRIPLSTQKSS